MCVNEHFLLDGAAKDRLVAERVDLPGDAVGAFEDLHLCCNGEQFSVALDDRETVVDVGAGLLRIYCGELVSERYAGPQGIEVRE